MFALRWSPNSLFGSLTGIGLRGAVKRETEYARNLEIMSSMEKVFWEQFLLCTEPNV